MKRYAPLAALAALSLVAACGDKDAPEPQNETTGAMMPDTDAVAGTGSQTAPDAADTGAVPADGSPPPVETNPPSAQQPAPGAPATTP